MSDKSILHAENQATSILTGVKPTDMPHLGNYVGAIRPAIQMVEDADQSFLFIADYHALNSMRDAAAIKQNTYQVAATWLALGVDPDKTIFYRQSDVPEIFELMTILLAITPKGLMDRSHAYKAMVDKNTEAGKDVDADVNMGLYTYPALMAADILIMQADTVPVGKDQIQHVEFARDMAGYFNNAFGNILKLPQHKVEKEGSAIPGLDGRKMSKSYGNHIPLFMEEKKRRKLIMKIVTDSKMPEDPKEPEGNTVYQLYTYFAQVEQINEMHRAFVQGGMGYGDAKKLLAEAVETSLAEPMTKYNELMSNTGELDRILAVGSHRAREVARETLSDVRKAIGLMGLT